VKHPTFRQNPYFGENPRFTFWRKSKIEILAKTEQSIFWRTNMRKLIAAVLLLSASTAAFAAAPAVMQAMADCTGSCPDCPEGK
jgi:hypothetical protein